MKESFAVVLLLALALVHPGITWEVRGGCPMSKETDLRTSCCCASVSHCHLEGCSGKRDDQDSEQPSGEDPAGCCDLDLAGHSPLPAPAPSPSKDLVPNLPLLSLSREEMEIVFPSGPQFHRLPTLSPTPITSRTHRRVLLCTFLI